MADKVGAFSVSIERAAGFEFDAVFDNAAHPRLRMDEPPPLGADHGPNPARVLAAAIGDCLSASLVFCMQKQHEALGGLKTEVHVELVRNERQRLRIGVVDVVLRPELPAGADAQGFARCSAAFEDFCVVTQSVREGLDVRVRLEPAIPAPGANP